MTEPRTLTAYEWLRAAADMAYGEDANTLDPHIRQMAQAIERVLDEPVHPHTDWPDETP